MKLNNLTIPLKPLAWSSLAALALAGTAGAVSPYDLPYGVQWSLISGHANADNPNAVAVSPDGSIWFGTNGAGNSGGSPMLAWGSNTTVYGGSFASGYAQISRLGGILQANDIPNVPGISNFNQTYSATMAFSGNSPKAYFGSNPNRNMLWTDAVPADASSASSQPMTFSIASVLGSLDPYCGFTNAPGDPLDPVLPRVNAAGVDPTEKFTHDMVSPLAYGGSAFDFTMDSAGWYYIARGAQGANAIGDPLTNGDSFTAGDHSGPVAQSYKPAVGKISPDGLTKSGPANQPACGGRSFFSDIDINETANGGQGRVYATGYGWNASGGTMDFFDPDGPGPLASIPLNSAAPDSRKGFAMIYNATTWAIDQVVIWETTYGRDIPFDITATADGGFMLCGITRGSMPTFTNPAEGTDDAYLEVYDSTGTLSWSFQAQTEVADSFSDAIVDADGNFWVSGNSDGNPTLWKFTAGGTLVSTTTIDNAGSIESQRDVAGDKYGIFFLSEHNSTAGTWPNTLAYVPQGTDENMLQRLSPGDFNTDGFVDFADVQIVGAATVGGATGTDTYDFDESGDSDAADLDFMLATIMERDKGDIAQDSVVTDVDNADLGKAIGNIGVGTLYVDGDINFDGAVDAADIAFLSDTTPGTGAFTGAKSYACNSGAGTAGATLLYNPDTGEVFIKADEADGGAITSFQLENNAGTFEPGNFTAPTAGSFGGPLAEASTSVIADTDLSYTGFSGLPSLGEILPTGLDLAGLQAYLVTAVYTGAPGTGQKDFTLEVGFLSDYDIWALNFPGADLTDPDADLDGDGLTNDEERLFGLDPTDPSSQNPYAVALDSGDGTFSFTRRDDALTGVFTNIEVSTNLQSWSRDSGAALVVTGPDANGVETVAVTLSPALLANQELYVRVNLNDGTLYSEDFESGDGGYAPTGTPNDWAYGTPNSNNDFNLTLTTGNNGSTGAWGTNLGNGAVPSGLIDNTANSILRSPDIDLGGLAGASLSFAAAVDANTGDAVQAIVRNAGDDSLLATIDIVDTTAAGVTADWTAYGPFDISAGAGLTVYVEFRFQGSDANFIGLYIDDVSVSQTP